MNQFIDHVFPPAFSFLQDLPTIVKLAFILAVLLKTSKLLRFYTTHRSSTTSKTGESFSFEDRLDTSTRGFPISGKSNHHNVSGAFKEPPIVSHAIPYLGHLFGLLRNQMKYYARISDRYRLPIYTLPLPGFRIYVVNSPELVTALQKDKTITFAPVETQLAKRLFNPSAKGGELMTSNTNCAEGERGLYLDGVDRYHAALLPGKGLDDMNRIALQTVAASCDKLDTFSDGVSKGSPVSIKLMQWLKHEVFMASTNAVYGPKNPFKDPNVESAFWDFERSIGSLIINIYPSLTARKGHLGRELLAREFTKYLTEGSYKDASLLVKTHYEVCDAYNLSLEDQARFEIGNVIAISASTIPSAYWMLYYVFSNPKLLNLLRDEVAACLETTKVNERVTRTLNILKLRTACPILTSTFQETLRHAAMGASLRMVTKDTVIKDQYFLRKNSIIQIPVHVVHSDPAIWGPTVADFDESRFVPNAMKKPQASNNAKGIKSGRSALGALRPFGGGKNLCPGRHFAATEIVALVAMMIMRYNLTCGDDGKWEKPKSERSSLAAVVREPDEDVEVKVSPRKGFEGGHWAFQLEDSEVIFAIDDLEPM